MTEYFRRIENAPSIVQAGADILVAGQAFFKGDHLQEAIEGFKAKTVQQYKF